MELSRSSVLGRAVCKLCLQQDPFLNSSLLLRLPPSPTTVVAYKISGADSTYNHIRTRSFPPAFWQAGRPRMFLVPDAGSVAMWPDLGCPVWAAKGCRGLAARLTHSLPTWTAYPAERFQCLGFSVKEISGITEGAPLGQFPQALWTTTVGRDTVAQGTTLAQSTLLFAP